MPGPASTTLTDRDVVRRLLTRVGLGPRPGDLDVAATAGVDATLRALLSPEVDAGAAATPPPALALPGPLPAAPDAAARRQRFALERQQLDQLVGWWLDRMAAADVPFPERMTWFWHGHFATSATKVRTADLMLAQNATLRRLGRGDFRTLAQAMVVDPAMLVWLDGTGNRVGHPNENLAREFMELFTLGRGNYSETDVRETARALTGWRVNPTTGTASPVPRAHDRGPETVLGTTAPFDATSVVAALVQAPASPRFLAGRLWRRFVRDTPPDSATLDRLVAAYGPGHDVLALLRAVVTSPAFFDPSSVLVRQPVEWLVAALRALRLRAAAVPPAALRTGLTGLGQTPFLPPNVGGWPAGTAWLTTASALSRLHLAGALAAVGDLSPVADVAPPARVDAVAHLLSLPPFTPRTAAALRPLAPDPVQLVTAALASPDFTVSA